MVGTGTLFSTRSMRNAFPCFVGNCSEVYLEKALQHLRPATQLPVAQELGEGSLAFLVHPTLAEADIYDTCMAIEKVMALASAER